MVDMKLTEAILSNLNESVDITKLVDEELANAVARLEKEIKSQREMIDSIKSRNPNSGDLSFDYYQLHEMESELKDLQKEQERRNGEKEL